MRISILPRFVVLKSKLNNKCLQLVRRQGEETESLQFSADEAASPVTKFEVEPAKIDHRFVHLKCCSNNKYFVASSSDGTLSAAADKPEEDQSKPSCTLFEPIAADIDDLNTFRFRSVSHGKHVAVMKEQERLGLGANGGDLSDAFTALDWWMAPTTDQTDQSKEDPTVRSGQVVSMSVFSVQFRTVSGVILNQDDVVIARGLGVNNTNNSLTATMDLSYTVERTTTWKNSDPTNVGVRTILTSGVPIVTRGTIQISPPETISYQWAESHNVSLQVGLSYAVIVPPMTRVTVNVTATKASCEVPFSYTKRVIFSDGSQATSIGDDGTCTSTGYYDINMVPSFEKL